MRQVRRNGLITAVVAGGALAITGYAQADSGADAQTTGSPGLISGNAVQLPVDLPVNLCGNTVNVVGLLNPAMGNACTNKSAEHPHPQSQGRGRAVSPASHSSAGGAHEGRTDAVSHVTGSAGVLSGNGLQLPVELPVNASGNTVSVVGIGNPAFGNTAVNESAALPPAPEPEQPRPVEPEVAPPAPPALPSTPQQPVPPAEVPERPGSGLAHTGAEGIGYAVPASAALLFGGVLLYRRSRSATGS
ncbi:chaplin [Streptomyces sp. NPDC006879]|uniref:chaplin n=1 Tax=Streptomyces sp. NPDC006879 TaxID=3364767 RepID=UPI00367E0E00